MAKQSHAREEENTKKSRIPNPVQSLHHLHPRRIGTKNSQETTPKQRECEPTKSLGKDRIPHKTHKVGDHRSLRACSTKGAGEWARYHSPIRCTLYCSASSLNLSGCVLNSGISILDSVIMTSSGKAPRFSLG
jgi:hypothetical protein